MRVVQSQSLEGGIAVTSGAFIRPLTRMLRLEVQVHVLVLMETLLADVAEIEAVAFVQSHVDHETAVAAQLAAARLASTNFALVHLRAERKSVRIADYLKVVIALQVNAQPFAATEYSIAVLALEGGRGTLSRCRVVLLLHVLLQLVLRRARKVTLRTRNLHLICVRAEMQQQRRSVIAHPIALFAPLIRVLLHVRIVRYRVREELRTHGTFEG